jgi:hypothetical protein
LKQDLAIPANQNRPAKFGALLEVLYRCIRAPREVSLREKTRAIPSQ